MRAQRGKFLSILIVMNASAISLVTIILASNVEIQRSLGVLPDWFSRFLVVFLIARLITLYAIWNLKRWGVLAFFSLECLEVAMGLFVFTSVLTPFLRVILAVPSFVILLGIWVLALRTKWQHFA